MNDGESKFLAWWQLLRAGNVFTAISNVIAGYLITQQSWQPIGPLLLMVLASALLYEAGMVLNDVFDAQLDAKERPERPIPSGRISRRTAAVVGWTLLVLGIVAGGLASALVGNVMAVSVSSALAACIVGYDAGLKSTFLGPWVMGACRMLNVLLGVQLIPDSRSTDLLLDPAAVLYAGVVGFYTVGLTYLARHENEAVPKRRPILIEFLMNSPLILLIFLPTCSLGMAVRLDHSIKSTQSIGEVESVALIAVWAVLWGILFAYVGIARTGHSPLGTLNIRQQVTRLIFGFVFVDAFVVLELAGPLHAIAILSLLIPTWIASRWAPMT